MTPFKRALANVQAQAKRELDTATPVRPDVATLQGYDPERKLAETAAARRLVAKKIAERRDEADWMSRLYFHQLGVMEKALGNERDDLPERLTQLAGLCVAWAATITNEQAGNE